MQIRPANDADRAAVLAIVAPILRAGETYAIDRDLDDAGVLAYWFATGHEVFVAEDDGTILGTYYLMANQGGGGAHVANCGYMTAGDATGRGVGRAMCLHSLDMARERGFRAMQYNLVIATNAPAVHLWQSCGFAIVGRLPGAFRHPVHGYVDALVMYREL